MTRKEWKKEVKKKLIDRDETITNMADNLGYSRGYVNAVLCGYVNAKNVIAKINEYVGIGELPES